LLLLVMPISQARAVIRVVGPRIHLSDLVGQVATDVDLGPAPAPGYRRRIHRRQVRAALQGTLAIRLPRIFDVETRTRSIGCHALLRRVAAAARPHLATGLRVARIDCRRPLVLPLGPVKIDAQIAGGRRAGRRPVTLTIAAGTWPPRTYVVAATIDGAVSVVVAAVNLPAGRLIARKTVRLEQRDASTLPSDAIENLGDLEGMQLTAPISAGAPLRRGSMVATPIVRRSAGVTISVTMQGLRVSSRGVARQDGKLNETILVLCNSSRLLKARVTGPHQVVVDP